MKTEDFPALFRSADKESGDAQKRFFGALAFNLLCLALASVASTFDTHSSWCSIAQAVILIGSLASAIYLATARPERSWYNGRAVAESVKTITWRFLTKAEPFDQNEGFEEAFIVRLKEVFEQNKSFAKNLTHFSSDAQITPTMRRIRGESLDERIKVYNDKRVAEQQTWYAKKAKSNKTKAKRYFIGLCCLNAAALFCSLLKIKFASFEYWPTDILVTCAAAAISWIQAKRFQELAASYALTAYEIGFIKEQLARINTERAFSVFVGDAENAFSREHTQWVARKDD
ncbi:DUF4231 domain-containing protein [Paraburkholderia rhizosphaerae]|uniref:Uncharacterized protein DUF4231 n=1 Tax=Paraburkholderia rhizosphaerae TaxID=480658 RepID=A0A4V3HF80_9BURK|nr:DUF4231 domain-containing protein [Paraburkholderia rhizosphaerae]TDY51821.1 uncharacterized protein DUF4231 [Paraburkholderia rhizosphaerae]